HQAPMPMVASAVSPKNAHETNDQAEVRVGERSVVDRMAACPVEGRERTGRRTPQCAGRQQRANSVPVDAMTSGMLRARAWRLQPPVAGSLKWPRKIRSALTRIFAAYSSIPCFTYSRPYLSIRYTTPVSHVYWISLHSNLRRSGRCDGRAQKTQMRR